MKIEVYEGSAAFAEAAAPWDRLATRGGVHSPYQERAWLEAWVACRGGGVVPSLWWLPEAETLAPFGRFRSAGTRVLRLLGSGDSDYGGIISTQAPAEAWDSIARALASWGSEADLLHLHSVPDLDAVEPALRRNLSGTLLVREYERCPWIAVDRSWEDLLAERGRDLRKNVKRWARRMEELGGEQIDVSPPGLRADEIAELEAVERGSWKWERGDAALRPGTQRDFLEALLRDSRAPLRLWRLRAGGRLVAFALVLIGPSRWYFYLSSFLHETGHAGSHLLARIVEAACKDPDCAAVDLLRGDFAYKRAWTDRAEPVYELAAAWTTRGRIAALGLSLRWRAARSARLHRLRARFLRAGDRR